MLRQVFGHFTLAIMRAVTSLSQAGNGMKYESKKICFYLIVLLVVVIPLFAFGLSNHGLWSADEPRVAEIGREMAVTGDFAVPMLNQKPFLEEPPLYYGALAVTFKAFGISDKVARIPSALFALATVLVLFFFANHIFGPRVALLSGLILATTGEYFRVAHWIVVDSALAFFVVSSMTLFITGYLSENRRKKFLCYGLLYVAATLAFYSKGFIGIVIPALGIFAFLAIRRDLREVLKMRLWLGIVIFLVMTFPWFVSLWQHAGWEYLKVFFVHNHLQRFLPASMAGSISGSASGHHHPFFYYLTEFPSGFLPWSLLLVPVFQNIFSRKERTHGPDTVQGKGRLFAVCWFFAGIIFLSVASTKRTLYLMPIFAPIALLTALYIDSTISSGALTRIGKVFLWVFDLFLLALGLVLTPAYFFAKIAYQQALSGSLLASTITLSVLVIAIALGGVFYLWRGRLAPYWVSISLPILLIFIFILVIVVPVLDRHKSFVPFCDQIAIRVPAERPLYGYEADETLRGVVPFYTRRYLTEVGEGSGLPPVKEEPYYVMVRDRKGEMERELLSSGKLHLMVKQFMGTDRTLALFSSRPAEKMILIGDPFGENKKH